MTVDYVGTAIVIVGVALDLVLYRRFSLIVYSMSATAIPRVAVADFAITVGASALGALFLLLPRNLSSGTRLAGCSVSLLVLLAYCGMRWWGLFLASDGDLEKQTTRALRLTTEAHS